MRLLTRGQIMRRLLMLAFLATAFTLAVVVVELSLESENPLTLWTAIAAALGLWGLVAVVRWRRSEHGSQRDWQSRVFLQALTGGFAFQAGVIGYFLAADVIAAVVGCAGLLAVVVVLVLALPHLEYEGADA